MASPGKTERAKDGLPIWVPSDADLRTDHRELFLEIPSSASPTQNAGDDGENTVDQYEQYEAVCRELEAERRIETCDDKPATQQPPTGSTTKGPASGTKRAPKIASLDSPPFWWQRRQSPQIKPAWSAHKRAAMTEAATASLDSPPSWSQHRQRTQIKPAWSVHKRAALTEAATRALEVHPGNATKDIKLRAIHRELERSRGYEDFCGRLEKKGITVDRVDLALYLQTSVPDLDVAQRVQLYTPCATCQERQIPCGTRYPLKCTSCQTLGHACSHEQLESTFSRLRLSKGQQHGVTRGVEENTARSNAQTRSPYSSPSDSPRDHFERPIADVANAVDDPKSTIPEPNIVPVEQYVDIKVPEIGSTLQQPLESESAAKLAQVTASVADTTARFELSIAILSDNEIQHIRAAAAVLIEEYLNFPVNCAFNTHARGGNRKASSSGCANASARLLAPSTVNRNASGKQKRKADSDGDSGDQDDGSSGKKRKETPEPPDSSPRSMACPFNKYDCRMFGNQSEDRKHHACTTWNSTLPAHLKQHLKRNHCLSESGTDYICFRCCDVFETQDQFAQHQRLEEQCHLLPAFRYTDKIDKDIRESLALDRKNPQGADPIEYWNTIYDACFPGARLSRSISPYYSDPSTELLEQFTHFFLTRRSEITQIVHGRYGPTSPDTTLELIMEEAKRLFPREVQFRAPWRLGQACPPPVPLSSMIDPSPIMPMEHPVRVEDLQNDVARQSTHWSPSPQTTYDLLPSVVGPNSSDQSTTESTSSDSQSPLLTPQTATNPRDGLAPEVTLYHPLLASNAEFPGAYMASIAPAMMQPQYQQMIPQITINAGSNVLDGTGNLVDQDSFFGQQQFDDTYKMMTMGGFYTPDLDEGWQNGGPSSGA